LRTLGETPIDVVLADLFMPEMNGIGLAQIIRRTNASMPIILLSGYEHGPEIEMEIRRGTITALIEKPISVQQLHDTLQRVRRPQEPPHES
jgi:YesN/AraC family two-component response regulator